MFVVALEVLGARNESSPDDGFGDVMSALADSCSHPSNCSLYCWQRQEVQADLIPLIPPFSDVNRPGF